MTLQIKLILLWQSYREHQRSTAARAVEKRPRQRTPPPAEFSARKM